jgi:hypothetical protein
MKSPGVEAIQKERDRQVDQIRYTPARDDQYIDHALAWAAVSYASPFRDEDPHPFWPWHENVWRPGLAAGDWERLPPDAHKWSQEQRDARIRELTKAGALIAAEIDRLMRIK